MLKKFSIIICVLCHTWATYLHAQTYDLGHPEKFNFLPAKKRNVSKSVFIGDWIVEFKKTTDSCEQNQNLEAFNASIGISDKLIGVDYVDNSPFFRGKISGNIIIFKRTRMNENSTQTQTLSFLYRTRNRLRATLSVQINSSGTSCLLEYSGISKKI